MLSKVKTAVAELARLGAAMGGEMFARDLARPFEWLNILLLSCWVQFLVTRPEEFGLPRYSAFHALEPATWATIFILVVVIQVASMRQAEWTRVTRAAAMMIASGIWAMIAVNFWQTDTAPISARTTTVLALAFMVSAVYLGLGVSARSRGG